MFLRKKSGTDNCVLMQPRIGLNSDKYSSQNQSNKLIDNVGFNENCFIQKKATAYWNKHKDETLMPTRIQFDLKIKLDSLPSKQCINAGI